MHAAILRLSIGVLVCVWGLPGPALVSAPATTSNGPLACVTASYWSGFSPSREALRSVTS